MLIKMLMNNSQRSQQQTKQLEPAEAIMKILIIVELGRITVVQEVQISSNYKKPPRKLMCSGLASAIMKI